MGSYGVFCGASGKVIFPETKVVFIPISRRLTKRGEVEPLPSGAVYVTDRLCMIDYEPAGLPLFGTYDGCGIILEDNTPLDITKNLGMIVDAQVYWALVQESFSFAKEVKERVWLHKELELIRKAKSRNYSFAENSYFVMRHESVTGLSLTNGCMAQYESLILNESDPVTSSCFITPLEDLVAFIYGLFYVGRQLQPNMYAGQVENKKILKVLHDIINKD